MRGRATTFAHHSTKLFVVINIIRMMLSSTSVLLFTSSYNSSFAFISSNEDARAPLLSASQPWASPKLENWVCKRSSRSSYVRTNKSFSLCPTSKLGIKAAKSIAIQEDYKSKRKRQGAMEIEGQLIEGISIAGHETCIVLRGLKVAFDIGRCPSGAVAQDFLFISHAHMDHIGGLPMYVATRNLYSMKPPTIVVPVAIKEDVEKLFAVHRAMDHSELTHNLVALNVGEEYRIRKDLVVRPFKTYHVIPSQGYIIYSVKQKLKKEYLRLRGNEIRNLKFSGVKITDTIMSPEIAFTGDTMSDFIVDPSNIDALKSNILIMETTFLDDSVSIEYARECGHIHLSEVASLANCFENKAILLIHFSARYNVEEIQGAVSNLPRPLVDKVFTLTEGFRSDHL